MKKNRNYCLLGIDLFAGVESGLLLSLLLATMFFIGSYGPDDLEHWASSWFIFNGYIPYRDFFQHHHPLLWYMIAPVFWFIDQPIDSFRVGRIIAFLFFCGGCLFIGKIVRELGGTPRSFLYALFMYLSYPVMAGNYIQNRPDTYMMFFLLWGLYEWILFSKRAKTKDLILCYLFFFISFSFLQKVVWFLLPFGLYQIFLLVKKEIEWSVFIKALLIPIFLTVGYAFYLLVTNSLVRYWELNWILNIHFFRDYKTYQSDVLDYVYIGLYVFFCLWNIIREKGLIRHLSFVFLGFGVVFYLMPKPYDFYWIIWTPFMAIISGMGFGQFVFSVNPLKRLLFMGILILSLFLTGVYLFTNALWVKDSDFEESIRALSRQMGETDQLVDYGDYRGPFLRNYPEHYYWYCLVRCAPLDSALFHRHSMPDWDKVIYEQKPKYIMYHKVYDQTYADDNYKGKQIMGVDEDWLIRHYQFMDKEEAYKRKE